MGIKYIIGVDASLRNVAASVIDNTKTRLDTFNITTNSGTPDHSTIDYVVEQFFDRLAPYFAPSVVKHRSTAVFIEHINFGKTGKATGRAELIGVLKWLIRQEGINVYGIVPKSANSFLNHRFGYAAKSRSTKDQKEHTKQIVHRHLGHYTRDDNIADAIVMSEYGYAYLIEKQRISVLPQCKVIF